MVVALVVRVRLALRRREAQVKTGASLVFQTCPWGRKYGFNNLSGVDNPVFMSNESHVLSLCY
jgi:hypothetical protein